MLTVIARIVHLVIVLWLPVTFLLLLWYWFTH